MKRQRSDNKRDPRDAIPVRFHEERGPFDIIGDVHGCAHELELLLRALGWDLDTAQHPDKRQLVFVGDLVDRGPDTPGVLRLAMRFAAAGQAWCVMGNHDWKLLRKLWGRQVQLTHGLEKSVEQLDREPGVFRGAVADYLATLPSHLIFDDGRLVIAHAGIQERDIGHDSSAIRDFTMFGMTTGRMDADGLPERLPWANDYRGAATIVYGRTPIEKAQWINRTINLDTGCCFGGKLTALLYPELTLVDVAAAQEYYPNSRKWK